MITDGTARLTSTQVAKGALESAAYIAVAAPVMALHLYPAQLTPSERRRIHDAIRRQYNRVRRTLGFDALSFDGEPYPDEE